MCSMLALGLASCSKTHDREAVSRPTPSGAEQRRIDEKRAEERRAEERRADDRRAEERKADRRAEARDDRRERLANEVVPVDPVLRATPSSALTSLAKERCEREARCKNIGAKEKYRTRAACVTEMERDKRDDLNSDVCPTGIREKELNDCLRAVREEDCGNLLDSLTRLNACRAGNLCAK